MAEGRIGEADARTLRAAGRLEGGCGLAVETDWTLGALPLIVTRRAISRRHKETFRGQVLMSRDEC
jgi:hypothetical protein